MGSVSVPAWGFVFVISVDTGMEEYKHKYVSVPAWGFVFVIFYKVLRQTA